ncbi:hypothetical protein GYA49_00290 [Candidatus Beckwithbacteria bacterium]|nr:hypothetical protein [Candidatus Beckwithbacteria bacterium]
MLFEERLRKLRDLSLEQQAQGVQQKIWEFTLKEKLFKELRDGVRQNPNYAEIADFLQSSAVVEIVEYLADQVWCKPLVKELEIASCTHLLSPDLSETVDESSIRIICYEANAVPAPITSKQVLPEENIKLPENIAEETIDSASIIQAALAAGGMSTYNGGKRIFPEYKKPSGKGFITLSGKHYLVETVARKERPIEISFTARVDPYTQSVVYGLKGYHELFYSTPDELFDSIAMRVNNGESFEES